MYTELSNSAAKKKKEINQKTVKRGEETVHKKGYTDTTTYTYNTG